MLDQLPDQALLLLFSFIPAKDLILSISVVCKRFRLLIISDWYWKRRYWENYGESTPFLGGNHSSLEEMQRGCVHGDFLRKICNPFTNTMHLDTLSASAGGLDCVYIMNPDISGARNLVAAGSRDHIIFLWRKRAVEMDKGVSRSMREFVNAELKEHRGWVWCLAGNPAIPNVLCSGSWDHEVRLWDVSIKQCIIRINGKHKAAVLSLLMPQPNLVVSGGYDKFIRSFDVRQKDLTATVCGQHTKAVLSLTSQGDYIYSGSEDHTVKLWDLRKPNELLSKYKCVGAAVTSLFANEGILSAAVGQDVHFFNTTAGQLSLVSSYHPGHTGPLTSVYHNLGMLITGSQDGKAMLHTMSIPHKCLKTFEHFAAVTDVDFTQDTVALSSSDRTVSLWMPKHLS